MKEELDYAKYVELMYHKGYYVSRYDIDLMCDEVICDNNKIIVIPTSSKDEETIYIFTGKMQKQMILSEPTIFRLYLEDQTGEFKDDDDVMLSTVIIEKGYANNLYTRNYATWKFGISFDNGIYLDSDRCLIFQAHKEIHRFDIEINNIDLFKKTNRKRNPEEIKNMMWID